MPTRGPQPGDDITPEMPKEPEPRPSRLPRWLQRLLRSEVKPGVVTDKSGAQRPGVWWRRDF